VYETIYFVRCCSNSIYSATPYRSNIPKPAQQINHANERWESEMTAQKTMTVVSLCALIAAALSGAWAYTRAGDLYFLVSAIFAALASVFAVVRLRRPGAPYPGPLNPANAGRTIAKFVGFAAACWLLVFVRVRGDIQSLVDPQSEIMT
jgi:hypothetical protein